MTDRKCFIFKFADIEVREREFLLIRDGERIAVEPKAFRVLVFLLQNPGRLVTKDEIVASVWNDSAVSDNSLTRSIAQLRRVLGDDTRQPAYILTVPTVGYRFLCEVSAAEDGFATNLRLETKEIEEKSFRDRPGLTDEPNLGVQEESSLSNGGGSSNFNRALFVGGAVSLALIALVLITLSLGRKGGSKRQAIAYPVVEQRVTANPNEAPIHGAAVSPDSKYLAYADPTGLYLRELSTGETRPWSLPAGFVALPNSWFPDSTHLLVQKIEGPLQIPDMQKSSLYKISLLGGPPQRIMDNAASGALSPDGARIAYLPGPRFGSELWVMNADGTNSRELTWAGVLKRSGLQESWIQCPVWSPEGKHIAYFEGHAGTGSDPHESSGSLMTIEPNGSGPSELWNDPRLGQAVWWSPDGRILFAYREDPTSKTLDYGIYSIRLNEKTGRATGSPQVITRAEGMIATVNTTADGSRLFLLRTKELTEPFIARFDARAHQFQQLRRLTLDENENIATAWTGDSTAVLFISNRSGAWRLFKQRIDETTPENLVELPAINLPRLSPDGSKVLYLTPSSSDATSGPVMVMGKPLAGGPPQLVVQDQRIVNYGCARAPAEKCVFSKIDGDDLIFVSFEVKNNANTRELLKIKNDIWNWVISPDGSKLAVVCDPHRVRLFSLQDGTVHDMTVKNWRLYSVDWSANGQSLLMPSVTAEGNPVILEVDPTGNARVVLQGTANTGFSAMIPSPDGRYGLLLDWTQAENNVWMVENF